MRLMSKLSGSLLVGLSLLAAGPATAATITFEGFGYSRQVTYFHDSPPNETGFAGEMLLTIDGTPYTGYCVDLDNDAPNTWTASIEPVSVINGGNAIAWLFDTFATTVNSDTKGAGLQVAIWEVLDDWGGTLDLSAGNFRLISPNAVKTQAQTYLSALPSPAFLATYVPQSFIVFSSAFDQAQHMITPEPASIVGLALAALALRRKRR